MTPLERRISPSLRCVLPSGSRAVLPFLTKQLPLRRRVQPAALAHSASSFSTRLILVLTGYRRIAPAYGTSHPNATRGSRMLGFNHDEYAPDGRITGMRSWMSARCEFGMVVMIVQLSTSAPCGSFHRSQSPANAKISPSLRRVCDTTHIFTGSPCSLSHSNPKLFSSEPYNICSCKGNLGSVRIRRPWLDFTVNVSATSAPDPTRSPSFYAIRCTPQSSLTYPIYPRESGGPA